MKSLNAKRIAAIVTGAALLGAGLAFAGPLTFQNVPIISNSGQPVVQVVIGSGAKPSDGVAAGNIAAAIGNLAYTSVPVTAMVNPNSTSALKVAVSSAKYSLTNAQVWLNESGVTSATGASYLFSALIGSVLNQGVQLGVLQNTKALQSSGSYAFPQSSYTTNSPIASPYTNVGSVPASQSVTLSNGGGVTFSSFTSSTGGKNDNLLQITSSQFSSLTNNWGPSGETSYLFLTGFPVYDQQSSVNSFALLDAGGAWEAVFNKPIANRTNSNTIYINAPIRMLGTNYTIINATGVGKQTFTGSTAVAGGSLYLASSATPLQTIYVGHNITSGPWTVQLQDLAQTTNGITAPAAVAVYYNGQQTNESTIVPGTIAKFNVTGKLLYVNVNSTFAGLYAYQKWAKMQMYNNVFKVTNNQALNKTIDNGWNAQLLWTNTTATGANTNLNQLYGIVVYNTSTSTVTPGQGLNFIQNPAAYKLTFIGDTLGNNYDSVSITSSTASGVNYAVSSGGTATPITAATPAGGTASFSNVTEPGQLLTVTSGIQNAFTYAGQSSSTALYDLTPYTFQNFNPITASGTKLIGNGAGSSVISNVVLTYNDPTASTNSLWFSIGNPVSLTITGYSTSNTYTQQSVTFSYNGTTNGYIVDTATLGTPLENLTAYAIQIQGNRALPIYATGSLTVNVVSVNTISSNSFLLGQLAAVTPVILYPANGKNYQYTTSSGTASINYNQQNGQPIANAVLTITATKPTTTGVPHQVFQYQVGEVAVPSNTLALDYLGVGLYNNTPLTTPNFILNYSTSGSHNNATYISTQGQSISAQVGFRTEKGSTVASISPSSDTFKMATSIDQLQFALTNTASNSVISKSSKTFGPYAVGQATNLPNVSIAAVNATPVLSGASTYSILGEANLTATASVKSATTPVLLKNLSSTAPLVVLDSNANSGSNLILVGSGYVNSLSEQLQASGAINITPSTSTPIVQAVGGNRIVVAGYTANQTTQAANSFISQLYAQAASST